MTNRRNNSGTKTAFVWTNGGWFGSQIGSTLWMLLLGITLLSKDLITATIAISSSLLLNSWGLYLWKLKEIITMYSAIQRFLVAVFLVTTFNVILVNSRSISPASIFLPYWTITLPLGLMLLVFILEQKTKSLQ